MKDVDPELYGFLKDNETGLYKSSERYSTKDKIRAFLHINFGDLSEFIKIVGEGHFEDGGVEVLLFGNSVCVELNEIIEGFDHSLLAYKRCFDVDSWNDYEELIIKDWD